jgi:hypothetical protein
MFPSFRHHLLSPPTSDQLKEPELLDPLIPAIKECLEHRHSYVLVVVLIVVVVVCCCCVVFTVYCLVLLLLLLLPIFSGLNSMFNTTPGSPW